MSNKKLNIDDSKNTLIKHLGVGIQLPLLYLLLFSAVLTVSV